MTTEEQNEMLASTLLAQERDYYTHMINEQRYEALLADVFMDKDGNFAERIRSLLTETRQRKHEVWLILNAIYSQLPDRFSILEAYVRLKTRGML